MERNLIQKLEEEQKKVVHGLEREQIRIAQELEKEKRGIPLDIYQLISVINSKYSNLKFAKGEFRGLNKKEKLSKLIQIINNDLELKRLVSLSTDGGYIINNNLLGNGELWLCIGREGLFIQDDDHYLYDSYPISSADSLEKCAQKLGAEKIKKIDVQKLRTYIVDYFRR